MGRSARWFWFTLALALHMSVAEAQERITSGEFSEWLAFYSVEPFGDQRADLRAGIIASTVASVFAENSTTGLAPSDFMPFQEQPPAEGREPATALEPPPPGSSEETQAFLAAMGATRKDDHEVKCDD